MSIFIYTIRFTAYAGQHMPAVCTLYVLRREEST